MGDCAIFARIRTAVHKSHVAETVSHRRRASPPAKGAGHIVIISSRAGLATSLSSIHSYLAAKHGRIGLIKQLAQELGPFGMSVNSVAPGLMATSPSLRKASCDNFASTSAMRRMGTPTGLANAVTFLASACITGQTIPVTGGPLA